MFYKIMKPIARIFCKVFFRVEINGEKNFPDGPFMVCANHSSNWDPVMLLLFIKRKIHFLGKQELFKNPFLRYIVSSFGMIPIKRGQADMAAVKAAIKVLDSGEILGIFPSGRRNKKLEKGQAKPGAAMIGARCGSKVVPLSIVSTYKMFSKVVINIGEPMDLSEYKGKKLSAEELLKISDNIYDRIIDLSKKQNSEDLM